MQKIFGSKAALLVVTAALISPVSGFSQRGTTATVDPNASNPVAEAYEATSEFLSEAYNEAFPNRVPVRNLTDVEFGHSVTGGVQFFSGLVMTVNGVGSVRSAARERAPLQERFAGAAAVRANPELEEARALVARLSPQDRAAMESLYRNTLELDPEYRAARGLPALSAAERTRLEAALTAETDATLRQAIVLARHQQRVDLHAASLAESRQRELERIIAGSNLNPEEKAAFRSLARQRRNGIIGAIIGLGLLADGSFRMGAIAASRDPGISSAFNFSSAIVKAAAERIAGSGEAAAPAAAGARGN